MVNQELAFAPAWELRQLIASRKVSPVEVTELFLRRIEALNPRLNAYLTVCADEALASARAAERAVMRGEPLGPLHGVPISVKDLYFTKGIRTTAGSLVFKDFVPDEDSVASERVRKAGAIILGKTNTPEFGLAGTTENRLGDACRNPWEPTCTSGGSSGGAGSGVAAGLCPLAIGSDGGGSIRIPSSFCGVYGLKPTRGLVPRTGGFGRPVFQAFSHIGPMAWTVQDAALLLQVLAGPDRRDPIALREEPPDFLSTLHQGVEGLRIAWSADLGYTAVDPEVVRVAASAARVFEELGATVEEPGLAFQDPFPFFRTITSANAYGAYGGIMETSGELLTDYTREALEAGQQVTGAQYARALAEMQQFQARMEDLFERYDLLLTPTLAVPAFPVGQAPEVIAGRRVDRRRGFYPFTFPFNMTGQPAASIPCGFSASGLPIGLQIVGRRGEDSLVLRASAAFEQARPWAPRRPPVS
jgi:aspartyl-tRNA(Asn)/glutamyl-tRNA(Gln) amidotransferase subunit A